MNMSFTLPTNAFRFLIFVLILTSCNDEGSDPTPDFSVRVVSLISTTTYPGFANEFKVNATFEYDKNGNQTSWMYNEKSTDENGAVRFVGRNTSNVFDAEDFLTESVLEINVTSGTENTATTKTTSKYSYENGLMTRIDVEEVKNGLATISRITYGYNSSGQVTDYDDGHGTRSTIEYNGTVVSKITKYWHGVPSYPDQNESALIYSYDSRGNITKVTHEHAGTVDAEYSYEFDGSDQMTRYEFYSFGRLQIATDFERNSNRTPLHKYDPPTKGRPVIPENTPLTPELNNVTALTSYDSDNSPLRLHSKSKTDFNYHASGYPASIHTSYFNATGKETATTETSYVYERVE